MKKSVTKLKKKLHSNTNATRIYQNIWDTAKLVLKRQFAAMGTNLEKREREKRKNLMMHLQISGSRRNSNPKPIDKKK